MTNTENKFEYNGLIYIAVEADGCKLCEFDDRDNIESVGCKLDDAAPCCGGDLRVDGRDVVFVLSDIDNEGKDQ